MNTITTVKRTEVADAEIGNPSAFLFDAGRMQALMAFAEMMSKGVSTVPKHLQGKPSDCLAITLQAMRWRMDPFVVGGKTNVVNGNLGYEAQLVIAVLKNSGAVRGRPHYQWQGEGQAMECRAGFIPAGEDAIVWTEWISFSAIKVKNSPLWTTNPKQQIGYLQARNWARLYAPDAMLGVYTTDELGAAPPAEKHMGAADVVPPADTGRPALPDYPAADFDKNLPTWAKVIADGRKTPGDLLAMLSTKAVLSEQQKAVILSLKARPDEPPPQPERDQFVDEMEAAEGDQQ